MSWAGVGLSCALAAWPWAQLQADDRESKLAALVIEYAAPASCPKRSAFERALAARLFAPLHAKPRSLPLRARFEVEARGVTASVELRDVSGTARARTIAAKTCREAVDALALITALALQPQSERDATPGRGTRPRSGAARAGAKPAPDARAIAPASSAEVALAQGSADRENAARTPNAAVAPAATRGAAASGARPSVATPELSAEQSSAATPRREGAAAGSSPTRAPSRATRGAVARESGAARTAEESSAATPLGEGAAAGSSPTPAPSRATRGAGARESGAAPREPSGAESSAAGEFERSDSSSGATGSRAAPRGQTAAESSDPGPKHALGDAVVSGEGGMRDEGASAKPGDGALPGFVAVGGWIGNGIGPRVMPGVLLDVQLRFASLGAVGLGVRAGLRFVPPEEVEREQGRARFGFWGGLAAVCAGLKLGAGFAADGCGVVEAGAVFARGLDTRAAESFRRPWIAIGPALHLSWLVVGPLQLQIGGELSLPAQRDRYRLADEWVHRVPASVLRAGVSLGLTF